MHYYNVQDQQVDKQLLDLMKHEMLKYKFIKILLKRKKQKILPIKARQIIQ